MTSYRDLPVALIDANPDQPRKHFDADKLRELGESIAASGLLEPVIVRPVGDRFVLIAGERRWRAHQAVGLEVISTRILDVDEVTGYVLSVAENVNRDDMTVLEEARSFDQLRRYGKTVDEVAALFGKRASTIRERLALIDVDPAVTALIEQGVVGPVLGYRLSFLAPGNQRSIVNRLARGEATHAEALEVADAMYAAEQQVGIFDVEEPTEEARAEHARAARKARTTANQIERLSAALAEIAGADPEALADALGADVASRLAALDDVVKVAGRARTTMRKAKAVAEARTLIVSDQA